MATEFRGPGVHHRVDDSPDDIDMDLESRFRPNSGPGSRIILLGDGTEISTDAPDSDMFDHADEDKDLDSQVDKFHREASEKESNGNAREVTPGPTAQAATSESPSSVKTEKSEVAEAATDKDTRVPEKIVQ